MATASVSAIVSTGYADTYASSGSDGTSLYRTVNYINMGNFVDSSTSSTRSVGLVFQGLTIPSGATINNAYITFNAYQSTSDTTVNLRIYGEQSSAAALYTDSSNFFGRTLTTNYVDWNNLSAWTSGNPYNTPDLKTIIQEFVDDYGGVSNASLGFQVRDNGSTTYPDNSYIRRAWSYEGSSVAAPYISINYSVAGLDVLLTKPISLSSSEASSISVSGSISSLGSNSCTARGFCYATASNPTTANHYVQTTAESYSTGSYYQTLTGISYNTNYYVRAFASDSEGTVYSSSSIADEGHFILYSLFSTIGIFPLTSKKIAVNKSTSIGISASLSKKLALTLSSSIGMSSSFLKYLTKNLSTSIGMSVNSLKHLTKNLSTSVGMSADIKHIKKSMMAFSNKIGLLSDKLNKNKLNKNISSVLGISSTYSKSIEYIKEFFSILGVYSNYSKSRLYLIELSSILGFNGDIRKKIGAKLSSLLGINSYSSKRNEYYRSNNILLGFLPHFNRSNSFSLSAVLGINSSINKKINYYIEFVLGSRSFPYTFPFYFSSYISQGFGLGFYSSMDKVSKHIISLDTLLGFNLLKAYKTSIIKSFNNTVGLVPNIDEKVNFIRNLDTLLGLISHRSPFAISKTLSSILGVYTTGLFSNYEYKKTVSINGSEDGDSTDYPMKLVIYRSSGTDSGSNVYVSSDCLATYDDIQFSCAGYAMGLNYWVESYTDASAVVWVKIPFIPSTGTSLNFYYGSTLPSYRNSGEKTFTFFDDFNTGESLSSDWTYSSSGVSIDGGELIVTSATSSSVSASTTGTFDINYALRARVKTAHYNNYLYTEALSLSNATGVNYGGIVNYCNIIPVMSNTYENSNSNGSNYCSISGASSGTYFIQDILRNASSSIIYRINDSNEVTNSNNVFTGSVPIKVVASEADSKIYLDWVLIRPYTVNEPAFTTWGDKETQPTPYVNNYIYSVIRSLSDSLGVSTTEKVVYGVGKRISASLGLYSTNSKIVDFKRVLSTSLGLLSSKCREIFKKIELSTSIGINSSFYIGVREVLSTSIGFISSFATKYSQNRSLSTALGLIADNVIKKEFIRALPTNLGINSSYDKYMAYSRIQEATVGIISKLGPIGLCKSLLTSIGYNASLNKLILFNRSLNSLIGINSSYAKNMIYLRSLISGIGFISSFYTRKISVYIRALSTTLGFASEYLLKYGGKVRSFSTSFGLKTEIVSRASFIKSFINTLGLYSYAPSLKISKMFTVLLGLKPSFNKHILSNYIFTVYLGINSSLNRFRNNYITFVSSLGLFSNIGKIGLSKSFSSSIGVLSSVKTTFGYFKSLSSSIGFSSSISYSRLIVKTLSTTLGITSSIGVLGYGLRKFKTLKFIDRSVIDKKNLKIKK